MHRLPIFMFVVFLSTMAHAGENPDARLYVDFDPPNYVHDIAPLQYSTVTAYVCLDHLGTGVTVLCFRMEDPAVDCPGVCVASSWAPYWPHPISYPDPWDPPSGACVSSTECVDVDEVVVVGEITLFYLGGSCCLELLDHMDYPRWVVDCEDPPGLDEYCVLEHGSIGGADCPEGDCEEVSVEPGTWGSMKALYR